MRVDNRIGWPSEPPRDDARAVEVAKALAAHDWSSLQEVVRWGFAQNPPSIVADVIVQDEFTHDVVLPFGEVHLVFDTT